MVVAWHAHFQALSTLQSCEFPILFPRWDVAWLTWPSKLYVLHPLGDRYNISLYIQSEPKVDVLIPSRDKGWIVFVNETAEMKRLKFCHSCQGQGHTWRKLFQLIASFSYLVSWLSIAFSCQSLRKPHFICKPVIPVRPMHTDQPVSQLSCGFIYKYAQLASQLCTWGNVLVVLHPGWISWKGRGIGAASAETCVRYSP